MSYLCFFIRICLKWGGKNIFSCLCFNNLRNVYKSIVKEYKLILIISYFFNYIFSRISIHGYAISFISIG